MDQVARGREKSPVIALVENPLMITKSASNTASFDKAAFNGCR